MKVENVESGNSPVYRQYLTTTELSKVFDVSRFSVINWVKKGHIRSDKTFGGHTRIPVKDAIDFYTVMHKKDANKCNYPNCWEYAKKKGKDSKCADCELIGREMIDCSIIVKFFGPYMCKEHDACTRCRYRYKFLDACDIYTEEKKSCIAYAKENDAEQDKHGPIFSAGQNLGSIVGKVTKIVNNVKREKNGSKKEKRQ